LVQVLAFIDWQVHDHHSFSNHREEINTKAKKRIEQDWSWNKYRMTAFITLTRGRRDERPGLQRDAES
jgi:hypothetical protein